MKLTIRQRMLSTARPQITWLEPGEYDVVRFFDKKKVIIDVTPPTSAQRQLTIVPLKAGYLNNNQENQNTYSLED